MSFLKISDPRKREATIKDFIETRKRIKDNFIAERVGEIGVQRELGKFFKPVTETQKTTAKDIVESQKETVKKISDELVPIKEGAEGLPLRILNQVFPSIEFKEGGITKLGSLAVKALYQAFTRKKIDLTYGLYAKDNKFYMGNKPVIIEDNDIIVDGEKYAGTPGLWELMISNDPNDFTEDDYTDYINLVLQTNTIYKDNNPNNSYPNNPIPKSSRSNKWTKLISPIWDHIKGSREPKPKKRRRKQQEDPVKGSGLTILPSDPNALLERLDLLIASQDAGHTGVRNELVSICDELKRQGAIDVNTYKKLNSIIKK